MSSFSDVHTKFALTLCLIPDPLNSLDFYFDYTDTVVADKVLSDIKSFSNPDRTLIIKKIHYLSDNFEVLKESKKVTQLKGSIYENQYRFVVARKIRILFSIEDDQIILLVLRIGFRKNIYAK